MRVAPSLFTATRSKNWVPGFAALSARWESTSASRRRSCCSPGYPSCRVAPRYARAGEGVVEPLSLERLEQIVERVDLEGAQRVLVEGGHEHHRGHPLGAHFGDHPEAVEVGHLDVEKDQVRLSCED